MFFISFIFFSSHLMSYQKTSTFINVIDFCYLATTYSLNSNVLTSTLVFFSFFCKIIPNSIFVKRKGFVKHWYKVC